MSSNHATGYVRRREMARGDVYYAHIRLPDGSRKQPKLGRCWDKRTRPPAGYLTEGMAQARLEAILAGDDPLLNIAPTRITFQQAVDEWLDYIEHDRKRRPSTLRDYIGTARNLLVPAFGASTAIEDITTLDVDKFRAEMVKGGKHTPRTVNKALVLAHGVFRLAQRRHGLRTNPVANAERQPEARSGDFRVLEPTDVVLLASKAESAQDATIYIVAAFTGLRMGELLGLRWKDVDFIKRLVHVRRSWVQGHEDTPKSHKVRSVPLIDQAARALDQLSRRDEWTTPDDRVFVELGEVVSDDRLRRRFKAALRAAGLQEMRFHDLRHTFGTLAVQAFPLSDVKAMMGHADISTTMIYVHHVPQHDAADKLGALVEKAQTGHPTGHRTTEKALQTVVPDETEIG